MATLAFSLVLVTLCFKLPIHEKPHAVGWRSSHQPLPETFNLGDVWKPNAGMATQHSAAQTVADVSSAIAPELKNEIVAQEATDTLVQQPDRRVELSKLPVLDFVEHMPAVSGGIGAYYIHIDYPEAAIREGIEGLLVLTFTVNTNGSTSDIRVTKPLHPLCDSAAVRALRQTAFIPGQHNGELVRVRMRLPVRFQLVDVADSSGVS